MNAILKIIIYYKKIKVAHPEMLIWLIIPILALFAVTNYLFYGNEISVSATNTPENSKITGKTVPSKFSSIITDEFNWNGGGVVSLIFTGAYKNQYDIAFPEVKARGLAATVAIPVNAVGLPENMTWLNLRHLQISGWKTMSQSRNQICNADQLNEDGVVASEVSGSKEDLENLGLVPEFYIPPCGIVNSKIVSEVTRNYKGLMTFSESLNTIDSQDNYKLSVRQVDNSINIDQVKSWIKMSQTNHTWLILSFPNIGSEQDNNHVNQDLLTAVLNELTNSNLQIDQPSNVIN